MEEPGAATVRIPPPSEHGQAKQNPVYVRPVDGEYVDEACECMEVGRFAHARHRFLAVIKEACWESVHDLPASAPAIWRQQVPDNVVVMMRGEDLNRLGKRVRALEEGVIGEDHDRLLKRLQASEHDRMAAVNELTSARHALKQLRGELEESRRREKHHNNAGLAGAAEPAQLSTPAPPPVGPTAPWRAPVPKALAVSQLQAQLQAHLQAHLPVVPPDMQTQFATQLMTNLLPLVMSGDLPPHLQARAIEKATQKFLGYVAQAQAQATAQRNAAMATGPKS
jgi:hypothetical protein